MAAQASMTAAAIPTSALGTSAAATAPKTRAQMQKAAADFEGVFLSQMLHQMTSGLTGPGPLSNGDKDPFAGMLQDEYARLLAKSGGVGIAGMVMSELLKTQEANS